MFRSQARGNADVIFFTKELQDYGGKSVEIHFNTRLHAKILIGKFGAFLGSANVTHSGFNYNDELFVHLTDKEIVNELRIIALNLGERTKDEWWRTSSLDYHPFYEFSRKIG
jgi:phosphatidylserine/phosphatidylglycerophosphate/cardiolipin synthase-like enzyme